MNWLHCNSASVAIDSNRIPSLVDQVARTNTFLLIFRKFMRPGELLKMFIDRFEDLGDYVDEDLEANNTRLRYVQVCLLADR